ncbi:ankyrin repeat and SAM domain-containing protein 4B-like [Uloborus diversus]|uniref:ankyrin repeat and SAM domain-containing protein 4B-like n=1 Tax=Uloborus diversus TaxID=327109 RepID=UPI0024090FB8|nr:ankyrin repeat and SAM domain-containing protein 4B-like [Uloborus diversus]
MSFLDPDRFHRAARDGFLDLLQEANRKELNSRDDDGMTPAMWAAYYGHLDALRLIVGRGGDPDKSDHYGNTCLHCAAGNGHTDCVSFLVNFGVNLWALDNDFQTAKEVAALNQREAALRLLDRAQSKHALVNKKLVQRLREKSVYDAEKRIKRYRKLQAKAAKRAEKEDKMMMSSFRKDSRFLYGPKFSDIVNVGEKKDHGALSKKVILSGRKKKTVVFRPGDVIGRDTDSTVTSDIPSRASSYLRKSGSTLDSVRENSDGGSCSPDNPSRQASDTHSSDDANSDVLQTADSGIGDELHDPTHVGIFDRPGFGTVAFRSSVVNLASVLANSAENNNGDKDRNALNDFHSRQSSGNRVSFANDSIGSAGSLVRRHITWEDECDAADYDDVDDDVSDDDDDDDDATDEEDCCCDVEEPLSLFLATIGLNDYMPLFQSEQIDLEALSLLSEDDLKALGMPLGPRRKLEKAVQQRLKIMEQPGIVQDSRL